MGADSEVFLHVFVFGKALYLNQNGYLKSYLRLDVIVCYRMLQIWGPQKGKRAKSRRFLGSTSDFCYRMLSYVTKGLRLLTEGL